MDDFFEERDLLSASRNGDLNLIRSLVHEGADINTTHRNGSTPLLLAAANNHKEVVAFLLQSGAYINYLPNQEKTVPHRTSQNIAMCSQSLTNGANISTKTPTCSTSLPPEMDSLMRSSRPLIQPTQEDMQRFLDLYWPITPQWTYAAKKYNLLHFASRNGWLDIVQHLIRKEVDINTKTSDGYSPLLLAAENNHIDIVQLLLQKNAEINCLSNRMTELHHASRNGWLEIAQSLLLKGAKIEAKSSIGYTPLLLAAQAKQKDIVKFLIDSDANLSNCTSDIHKWTLLHLVSENGWIDITQYLISKEIDINARARHGCTPIILAAMKGQMDVVKLLIDAGANLNCHAANGWRVLHYASYIGCLDIVQSLVERETNLDVTDTFGITPLFLAADKKHKNIIELLINAGANIRCFDCGKWYLKMRGIQGIFESLHRNRDCVHNILNRNKSHSTEYGKDNVFHLSNLYQRYTTLVHLACEEGWLEVIEGLLKKGANIEERSFHGETALHVAVRYKKWRIVEYLLDKGADCNAEVLRGDSPFSGLIKQSPDIKILTLFIENGAYLKANVYNTVLEDSFLKEHILQDIKLCTHAIVNQFNHKDLTELYKLTESYKNLSFPVIDRMKIVNNSQITHEVIQYVEHEIQAKGYCNVLEARPIVLKMLSIKSFLGYCDAKKKEKQESFLNQLKRWAELDDDENQHNTHKIRRFSLDKQ